LVPSKRKACIITFLKPENAKRIIFEYIEVFYNRIRRHAKIGNQIPADFASQHFINNQIAA
jgi:transposase InsO family protein